MHMYSHDMSETQKLLLSCLPLCRQPVFGDLLLIILPIVIYNGARIIQSLIIIMSLSRVIILSQVRLIIQKLSLGLWDCCRTKDEVIFHDR